MRAAASARIAYRGLAHASPYLAAAVMLLAELPLLLPQPFVDSDALLHWFVGHLVVTGGSPYDSSAWRAAGERYGGTIGFWASAASGVAWPYPPWTAWLLAPFGLLPPLAGTWIAVGTFLAAGVAAALIATGALAGSWSGRASGIVLGLAFQPFVYAVNSGQFSTLLALGFALLLASPERAIRGPVAFALLIAKPQLSVVLVIAAAADLVRRDKARSALLGGAFLALALVSVARFPDVLALAGTGLAARVGNQIRVSSSSWSLASAIAGDGWLIVGGLFVLATLGCWVAAIRWAPVADRRAVMLAGASIVSVTVAPVVRSYDQALLLPAIAVLVLIGGRLEGRARAVQRLMLMFTVLALPWALFVSAQLANSPPRIAIVPLAFAAALLWTTRALKTGGPRRPEPPSEP